LKIPGNLSIHDVISVQNMNKTLNSKDDTFKWNPDTVKQRIISLRDMPQYGRRYRVWIKLLGRQG